jgi:hypothetical protein
VRQMPPNPRPSAYSIEHRAAYIALAARLGPAHVAKLLHIPGYVVRKWQYRDRLAQRRLPVITAPSLVPSDADLADISVTDQLRQALSTYGTMGAAISALGMKRKDLAGVDWTSFGGGHVEVPKASSYILTYAQNDTPVHAGFWKNLAAYASTIGAEILVGAGTYQLGLYRDHAADPSFYAAEVRPHILKTNGFLFGDVLFGATANLLPTVTAPLSKWRTRGKSWVIVPHVRQHLESVPRMLKKPPKIIMSTGSCTVANYAARAAGQAASWHHTLGAIIVEHDGSDWHVRHITADETGEFQDWDAKAVDGVISYGHPIDTLVGGDLHLAQADRQVVRATWGWCMDDNVRLFSGSIIDELTPLRQVMHDALDFMNRNHHGRQDVMWRLERLVTGNYSVGQEVEQTSAVLSRLCRPGIETVMVKSNHDDALDRWVASDDGRKDEANVRLWHHLNYLQADAIMRRVPYDHFENSLRMFANLEGAVFPERFSSYEVDYPAGPIEYNLHGDKGNGGARGSAMGFVRAAPKVISAHSHTPYRREGHGCVGTSTNMDMVYNRGLSTWAHAHIIVYPSGHWTHVFIRDGRYRRPAAANQNLTPNASVGIAA